jgi:hypothetical protein
MVKDATSKEFVLLLLLLLVATAVLRCTCVTLLGGAAVAPNGRALPGCCILILLCVETAAGWLITPALPPVTLAAALNKPPNC